MDQVKQLTSWLHKYDEFVILEKEGEEPDVQNVLIDLDLQLEHEPLEILLPGTDHYIKRLLNFELEGSELFLKDAYVTFLIEEKPFLAEFLMNLVENLDTQLIYNGIEYYLRIPISENNYSVQKKNLCKILNIIEQEYFSI